MSTKLKSSAWPKAIKTEHGAYCWFLHLMVVDSMNFHPDDNAEGYVDENGRPTFSEAEAIRYNTLMDQAFEVCDDVYEVGLKAQRAYQDTQVFSTRKWEDGSYMVQMRGDGVYDTVGELHMPKGVAHRFATELNEAALRALLANEQHETEVTRAGN